MLQVFPFLGWTAAITSAVLLVVLWDSGELRRRAVLVSWFLVAAYGQFLGGSMTMSTVGLVLQTALAIYLLVRYRLSR